MTLWHIFLLNYFPHVPLLHTVKLASNCLTPTCSHLWIRMIPRLLCYKYPLPRIQDVYHRRQKFKYMTILDLTACYYTYQFWYLKGNKQKIVLPEILQEPTIKWYHMVMGHGGATRIYKAIGQFFLSPRLKAQVEQLVLTCNVCQRNKNLGQGYGHLPPQNNISTPWEEIAIDLIGPWEIDVPHMGMIRIAAFTAINTATGLAELIGISNRSAAHIALKFEQMWLSRYPRPLKIVHDQGNEFTGANFQIHLHRLNIESVPTTVKNPQSNAMCERMHMLESTRRRIRAISK